PFRHDDLGAQLDAITREEPDAIGLDGQTGKRLETIIMKGLRKDPDARWQTVDDLGRELATWLWDEGVEVDISNQSIRSVWLAPASNPLATTLRSPMPSKRSPVTTSKRIKAETPVATATSVRKRFT